MIGIQLSSKATDETVKQINSLTESNVIFEDHRRRNQEDANTYLAVKFLLYSFMASDKFPCTRLSSAQSSIYGLYDVIFT